MEEERMQNQADESTEFQESTNEPHITSAGQTLPRKAFEPKEKMRMREKPKVEHTKKERPQTPPRRAPEPKVSPATAALRKQYADVQSKIAPAKPAARRIRWTPNLPIPPPDSSDVSYASADDRLSGGFFSAPPRVSEEEKRKRKREEGRLRKEDLEADGALDTEVLRKPKRGGKRLSELETAMVAAGMYPEDPDGRSGKEMGRKEGKRVRPWEDNGKKGRGKGGGKM